MIMAGYEYKDSLPFKNVYLTGIVRDKKGRKMSKSLGNSPDPIELIEKYGADGVRVGMLLSSPAGNDLPFDESLCEQGRNFSNKIWNATRLIKGWEVAELEQPESSKIAVEWFENKFQHTLELINDAYSKYRISEALMLTYRLVWDDFCSWYLESVKPDYQKPIDRKTLDSTIFYMESLLKLLHPFMPFISEEIWHLLATREKDIIVSDWPKSTSIDAHVLHNFDYATEIVSAIRTIRKDKQIPNKDTLKLFIKTNEDTSKSVDALVSRLANLSELSYTDDAIDGAFSFRVKSNEFFVPLSDNIDVGAELEKLRSELDYTQGFLKSVMGKLSNERFVNNAPEQVVAIERKKQSDAEAKIAVLQEQIKAIS
jgi:valyl-tRNA synthetase